MINSIPTLQKLSLEIKFRFFANAIKAKNTKGTKNDYVSLYPVLKAHCNVCKGEWVQEKVA